jgi:hypothetical protein
LYRKRLAFDNRACAETGHLAGGYRGFFKTDTFAQHAAEPQDEKDGNASEDNQENRKIPKPL